VNVLVSLVNIYAAWLIVMNGRQRCHECTNMGKVKLLESWWQLYVTWLPVRNLGNSRPFDFCWTEGTRTLFYTKHCYLQTFLCELYKQVWCFTTQCAIYILYSRDNWLMCNRSFFLNDLESFYTWISFTSH